MNDAQESRSLDARSSTASPAGRGLSTEAELSLLEIVNLALRRWRVVCGFPVAAAVLSLGASFIMPVSYRASTTFVAEVSGSRRVPAGLVGFAGQLGISLGSEGSYSPRFYAEVLQSRELMDSVLMSSFANSRSGADLGSMPLYRILQPGGRDLSDSLEQGRRTLRDLMDVRVNDQTSILTLSVLARDPRLAADVANQFVTQLNRFNTDTRQSQARERRRFAEVQLRTAESHLRLAEEEMRQFQERNRSWQASPQLVFEEGRLRRQVELRQEIYVTLTREYETARIEEVNDTPVITIIETAVPPKRKARPRRGALTAFALVFGGMVGLLWAFGAGYLERASHQDQEQYDEFRRQLRHIVTGLRALVGGSRRT